jgi:2-succinyl-5-enolpyruvyl-6-hydroxy-3-cyclohexene-1-carboxylate synthase
VGAADVSFACAAALFDELASGGVRHVCLSPGSRSTPLALAVARDERFELHVHLDERSGAFFALGLAKSLRAPVAVVCTSGTAAAELFPAVVEASQSRIPLIMLTADRPPRLRGTGANQTIDQERLYGRHARAYLEPPVPAAPADTQEWRRAGLAALDASEGDTPGPVQIDCPFDEPLVPQGPEVPTGTRLGPSARGGGRASPSEVDIDAAAGLIDGRRGVVVIGPGDSLPPDEVTFLAQRLRWPVIAEPTSNVRRPGAALRAGQAILGASAWIDVHRPEAALQVGAAPTTRSTQRFVARAETLVVADALHLDPDPLGHATLRIHTGPGNLAQALADRAPQPAPADWLDEWRLADTAARRAMDDVLDRSDSPSELQIARDVAAAVPTDGTLFVGNSMPIRDLDEAMAPRDGLEVLANRGASGIDGLVSTALGIASAGPRPAGPGPTVALLGDLSLLHDVGALFWDAPRGAQLAIVVVNNAGGQIFSLLDQRGLPELERLFVTPHAVDLGALCAAAGVGHARVDAAWAFGPALDHAIRGGGLRVVETVVDPDAGRIQRALVREAVDAALAELAH